MPPESEPAVLYPTTGRREAAFSLVKVPASHARKCSRRRRISGHARTTASPRTADTPKTSAATAKRSASVASSQASGHNGDYARSVVAIMPLTG